VSLFTPSPGALALAVQSPIPILLCIILVPVVPAYLLFASLPSAKGSVDGTLAGLRIKLGGAFAGYFAVVTLIFSTHNIWNPPAPPPPPQPPPPSQVWRLYGSVLDQNNQAIQLLKNEDFKLSPANLRIDPNGNFQLTFSTEPTAVGGGITFPTLTVGHKGFDSVTIPLEPTKLKAFEPDGVDTEDQLQQSHISRITLSKSKKPSKYNLAAKPLAPLTGSQIPASYSAVAPQATAGRVGVGVHQ
jgi:hypothetical protein